VNFLNRNADAIYSVMRLVVGLLFACHGAQKLFGMFGGQAELNDPEGVIAGIIEFAGGWLVALGLFTRIGAFLAAGEMAVAYFKAHAGRGWFPIQNHGEAAVVYCFIFLFIFFHGPGRWSIDSLIWRKTAATTS